MKKHFLIALSVIGAKAIAQQPIYAQQLAGTGTINPITTAVPFLLISPDSKQGAMGDVGAATEPDVNSIHWNGSKLAFMDKKFGVGCTVTPWLRNLVPDINLYYLTGYVKMNDKQAVGASLRYFTLGNIELTDATGNRIGDFKPNEFAIDLAFSQKLSKNFALGVAARFINSGISRVYFNGSSGNAASTGAVDVSMFYKSNPIKLSGKNSVITGGLAFTNLGAKIKYSNDENFIPMNMRLGGGLKTDFDKYNSFGVYVDFNKLLVPTPPIYNYDSNGNIIIDPATGKRSIAAGKDPNVDVTTGIIQSFGDAPGGFKEELLEINKSIGVEYNYSNVFAVRAGYFHESKKKGARQFFTIGIGSKFNVIGVDFSFLIPTLLNNPLQRTWRATLSFNFNQSKAEETPKND